MWGVDGTGGDGPPESAGAPPPQTDGVEKERRNSVNSLKEMWNVGDDHGTEAGSAAEGESVLK